MTGIPACSPIAVDTATVLAALNGALVETGDPRRARAIVRRPFAYATSHTIEELTVELATGERLALLRKDLSRRALLGEARQAKPAFLHEPMREIEVYRHLLVHLRLGTAAYYGAHVLPESDRYWLFLEHVDGLQLRHVGDFSIWRAVAHWLGRFHGHFDNRLGDLTQAPHLLVVDDQHLRGWVERARRFAERPTARWPAEAAGTVMRLAERYDEVVKRLLSLPVTLRHGEFFPANVIVAERDGHPAPRICPVDWEMAGMGPGLLDLAALCAGSWLDEERQVLLAAYLEGWAASSARALPYAEAAEALRWCRLQVAVQWLGWADDWTPPLEEQADWLGETRRLAAELSL